jgi:hypothetical protein
MTDQRNEAAKASAEAAFHLPVSEAQPGPLAEYRAKQDAERVKMARLKAERLAKGKYRD